MLNSCKVFVNTFWSEHFWLPPNTTWDDIHPNAGSNIRLADYKHLFYPLPMTVLMLLLRCVLEKYCFAPVAILIGIKHSIPKKAPDIPVLENAFNSSKRWKRKQVQGLAKQLDMSERQIERWLRLRKGRNKPSTLKKFCENSWKCAYYIFSFTCGIIILWDKPWLWDINECWTDFLHQDLTNDIWWYYMISMTFYWSLCISQFFDVKRKDFWQMFFHHIATVALMCLSWIVNAFRVGSLVLLVHDCADIFLEASKMAKYSGYQKICDAIFALFTIIWIVTRLGIYPFWIIRNTCIDVPNSLKITPSYYIFNSLLCLLLAIHCYWTYLILKIVRNSLKAGQMAGDIRSSSED